MIVTLTPNPSLDRTLFLTRSRVVRLTGALRRLPSRAAKASMLPRRCTAMVCRF